MSSVQVPAAPAILLGDGDVALSLARNLAREGIRVIQLYAASWDHAHLSRFVSEKMRVPPPARDDGRLLDVLTNSPQSWINSLLVACQDSTLEFVGRHKELLEKRFRVPLSSWTGVERILNKKTLYEHASELGVTVPRFVTQVSSRTVAQIQKELGFPCLIKPCFSHHYFAAFQKKLTVVRNAGELFAALHEADRSGIETMAVQLVPGVDSDLFHYRCYLDRNCAVQTEICTQKIRQFPPGFGVACYSRTVPMIEELKMETLRLLTAFGYHGVASAEYKRDRRSGRHVLIEINVRPALPERLFAAAGANFAATMYRDLVLGVKTEPTPYRVGLHWRHNFLEMTRLLVRRDLSLREYLRPLTLPHVNCVPLWDDPLPYLKKIAHYVALLRNKR